MSKVTTAAGKKRQKKKKVVKASPGPDLQETSLHDDVDLESELEFSLDCSRIKSLDKHASEGQRSDDTEPMFPHELHLSLKNQIQGLEEEREELKTKLREMEERLAGASPLRNLGRGSDLAANRIVELGKKVKELQAQIKTQNSLSKKPTQSDNGGGGDANHPAEKCNDSEGNCCGQLKPQLDEMTDKYSSANAKLCELRNQNQQLRHEHKLALKALWNEIGEKMSVQNILSGGQGWRGRAQQILSLQQKVNELSEKLTAAQCGSDSNEDKAARMEAESLRCELDGAKAESEGLRTELSEARRKLEESKARVRSLQAELSVIRSASSGLHERAAADKKVIDNLNAQLGSLNEKAKGKECILNNKYEYQISLLKKDLSQERQRNDELAEAVKERDNKIVVLQAKTSVMNQSCSASHPTDVEPSEPRSKSARSSSVDREICSSNAIGSEAERVRLMELVGVNSRRLQEERKTTCSLEEQLRCERHRCVRLETKLARLELERVGWAKGLYRKPPALDQTTSRSDTDWDALKDKTELLEEKCLALESRIKTLQQEKDDDNRRFIQIIEEQRTSYLDLQKKTSLS